MKLQVIVVIVSALMSLLAGKLGIDLNDANFDLAKFLSDHLAELFGGMGGLGAILAYFLRQLQNDVSPKGLGLAISNGDIDFDALIDQLRTNGGALAGQMSEAVGAASADFAFVRLFHHCEFDKELTGAINAAHNLYRLKRAKSEPKPA